MNNHGNKYKSVSGSWITQSLFVETANNPDYALYRLREGTAGNLPVLKDLYLSCMDYTEYNFANKYLGGWEHWQRLLSNAMISREIEKWREELEIKLVATGLLQITDIACDTEHKGRLAAAKFLAESGFKPKNNVGRPTKKEQASNRSKNNKVASSVSDDLERIRSIQ